MPEIMQNTIVVPIVLCGGAGTRLWPMSRGARPKPFMELPGGGTLLAHTYRRARAVAPEGALLTITNRDYFFLCRDELEGAGIPAEDGHFLLEPVGRNTAPAIAAGAHWVRERFGDDAVILVLAADHLIEPIEEFRQAVGQAVEMASSDWLVTFGIEPSYPETGYGYIECGAAVGDAAYAVARFIEKPPLERAKAFLAQGNCLWNSGMFAFKAGAFLASTRELAPELDAAVAACWQATCATKQVGPLVLDPPSFAAVPSISVDYAVMEKAERVAVVRTRFEWNDIGSWLAASTLIEPDAEGNRISGEVALVDVKDTFVLAGNRLVAAVGVQDLLIVETPDALLVAHRDRAQDVKRVVSHLDAIGHAASYHHQTTHRPWGSYTVLEEGPGFKSKRLVVKPGKSLSLQMHHHRSEHWVVVAGEAEVVNGEELLSIRANESTYIPAGHRHRLANRSEEPLVVIEVQTGDYLEEDDIVRFEDSYGRV